MALIEVFPQLSPRLILSDQAEVTMQELVDLVNEWEQLPSSGSYPALAKSTGKVDLGGGTLTGINMILQNAVLGFEQLTAVISTGACTSVNPLFDNRRLIDAGATFISDGVTVGMSIYNEVDKCLGTVIDVISETELLHLGLGAGSLNVWTVTDTYRVWDVQQRLAGGGNLAAIDSLGAAIDPLHPTFGTYATRTTSVSATLTEQSAIQFSSFNGGVSVDVTSSNSGTAYPAGTPEFPVNNMADAHTIADSRGFKIFNVVGNLTLASVDVSDGHIFVGQSRTLTLLTLGAGADVSNCEFQNATVTGTLDGGNTVRDCSIVDLNIVNGLVDSCGIRGTLLLGGGTQAHIVDCHSGVAGSATPELDMGGSGQQLLMRNYSGGIELTNHSGTDAVSIDMASGHVIIAATVTAGTIIVRGITKITNESTGTAVVDSSDAVVPARLTNLQWQVESLRRSHQAYDEVIYMDPDHGDDANDGTAHVRAVLTFAAAHALVTTGHRSVIFIHAEDTGAVVVDERWVITKPHLSVRGPGRGILLKPSVADLGDTISIQADHVALSHFIVEAATGNTLDDAIRVEGKHCLIENMWVNRARNGVVMAGGDYSRIVNCDIEKHTADGVLFDDAMLASGSPREVTLEDNNIYLNGGSGINLTAVGANSTRVNRIFNCNMHDNTNYGVAVGANVEDTLIDSARIHHNGLGRVNDNGVDTHDTAIAAQTQDYGHAVVIDVASGVAGSDFPIGTAKRPSNNLTDALLISATNGTSLLRIVGTLVVGGAESLDGFKVVGTNALVDTVVLTSGCSTAGTVFEDLIVTGAVDGGVLFEHCAISTLSNIGSDVKFSLFNECVLLEATLTFQAGLATPQNIQFVNCVSGVAAAGGVVLDFNGTTSKVAIRKHAGSFAVSNFTQAIPLTIDLHSGHVTLNASVTAGTISARGFGDLTDSSAGATVVNGMINPSTITDAVWDEALADHTVADTMGSAVEETRAITALIPALR